MQLGIATIEECRDWGYPVVDHHGGKLNVQKHYLISFSNPKKWKSGKHIAETPESELYICIKRISYEKLWAQFVRAGTGIKEFCDFKNFPFPSPMEDPTFHDLLNLASTVRLYQGIE